MARRELVEAGAGCGKTESLVRRYASALGWDLASGNSLYKSQQSLRPRQIIALTFTEEAARQMQERLTQRLKGIGQENLAKDVEEEGQISTFHGLCLRLIRPHLVKLGYKSHQVLLPSLARLLRREHIIKALSEHPERKEIIKAFSPAQIADMGADFWFDLKELDATTVKSFYLLQNQSFAHFRKTWQEFFDHHLSEDIFRELKEGTWVQAFQHFLEDPRATGLESWNFRGAKKVSDSYPQLQRAAKNYRDFLLSGYAQALSDGSVEAEIHLSQALIHFLKDAVASGPKILDFTALEKELSALIDRGDFEQKPCALLIVDEFQDTNRAQFKILRALSGEQTDWYFVGDPKQSIYGFRGADVSLFLELREQLDRVELDTNYRSEAPVLSFTNEAQELLFQSRLATSSHEKHYDPPAQTLKVGRKATGAESGVNVQTFAKDNDGEAELALLHDLGESFNDETASSRALLFLSWRELYRYTEILDQHEVRYEIAGSQNFLQSPLTEIFAHFLTDLGNENKNQGLFEISRWRNIQGETSAFQLKKDFQSFGFNPESFAHDSPLDLLDKFSTLVKAADMKGGPEWTASMERLLLELSDLDFDLHFSPARLAIFLQRNIRKLEASVPSFKNSESAGTLRLLTIHGSKGLEFDHVFLPELYESRSRASSGSLSGEEGLSIKVPEPSLFFEAKRHEEKIKKEAEMRRLFYVALTRAKAKIFIYTTEISDSKRSEKANPFEVLGWPEPRITLWNELLGCLGKAEIEIDRNGAEASSPA